MVEIRWLGTAGLEIAFEGRVLLIDPYLTRAGKADIFFRRLRPSAERVAEYAKSIPGQVSAVVCGHTHFDHALDIPLIARHMGCVLVGSDSLKTLIELAGINPDMRVCRGGEFVELPGHMSVRMIPSLHGLVFFGRVPYPGEIDPFARPPLKASEYKLGGMFTPLVEAGGVRIMHQGSANFIESKLEGQRCDILFMCVPGWKKVPGYPSKCIEMLRPEVVVPFHFDDFTAQIPKSRRLKPMPGTDLEGFVAQVKKHAPGIVVKIPDPHEVMRF
jgi:L-ascorbate metabolism protein UlaG (beta-lactamase superfamily)